MIIPVAKEVARIYGYEFERGSVWKLQNTEPHAISVFIESKYIKNIEPKKTALMKEGELYKVSPSIYIRLKKWYARLF